MVNPKKTISARKRGRPAGQNRVPLTEEQRRARNAEYERERRIAYADALEDLAGVVDCPENMSHAELIRAALEYIKGRTGSNTVEALRQRNEDIKKQIETLKQRLDRDR